MKVDHFGTLARILVPGEQRQSLAFGHVSSMPTRKQTGTWIALLIATVVVSLGNYQTYQVGTHFDDARYVILARSLVLSDHYGMINAPDQPAAKYPFGYPLLLAPLVLLFPEDLDVLKVISLIAIILNVTILFWGWRWFSRSKSYWWGIAVVGLYALSPFTIGLTRRVMSEPVFVTFCLIALVLTERAARGKQSRWWSLWMSVALLFVVFTRTIGILLVISIFIYLLLIKGRVFWKEMALIAAQMAILAGLVVATTAVQVRDILPSEYLKDENARLLVAPFSSATPSKGEAPPPGEASSFPAFSTAWTQKAVLARDIFIFGIKQHFGKDIRDIALPLGGGEQEQSLAESIDMPFLPLILGFLVSGLVLFGLGRLLTQEGLSVFFLFAVLYIGALFLWVWNDPRLLYPVQAQIHFGLLLGLEVFVLRAISVARRINFRIVHPNLVFASLVSVLVVISVYKSLRMEDSRLHAGDLQARSSWLRSSTSPSDIVMSEVPEIDYLYSGRKTVAYPAAPFSAIRLEEYLLRHGITYVLVAPKVVWRSNYEPAYSQDVAFALPLLTSLTSENRARLVYSSERDLIKVFQIQPGQG